MSEKCLGTVQWFSNDHGYGMAKSDDGTQYFVHYSECVAKLDGKRVELWQGQVISFTAKRDHPRGPRALEVEIIR